jgi:hypothetical protein
VVEAGSRGGHWGGGYLEMSASCDRGADIGRGLSGNVRQLLGDAQVLQCGHGASKPRVIVRRHLRLHTRDKGKRGDFKQNETRAEKGGVRAKPRLKKVGGQGVYFFSTPGC